MLKRFDSWDNINSSQDQLPKKYEDIDIECMDLHKNISFLLEYFLSKNIKLETDNKSDWLVVYLTCQYSEIDTIVNLFKFNKNIKIYVKEIFDDIINRIHMNKLIKEYDKDFILKYLSEKYAHLQ